MRSAFWGEGAPRDAPFRRGQCGPGGWITRAGPELQLGPGPVQLALDIAGLIHAEPFNAIERDFEALFRV